MILLPKKFKCQPQQASLLPDFQSHQHNPSYPFPTTPNLVCTLDSLPIPIPGPRLRYQHSSLILLLHSPYKNLNTKATSPLITPILVLLLPLQRLSLGV